LELIHQVECKTIYKKPVFNTKNRVFNYENWLLDGKI